MHISSRQFVYANRFLHQKFLRVLFLQVPCSNQFPLPFSISSINQFRYTRAFLASSRPFLFHILVMYSQQRLHASICVYGIPSGALSRIALRTSLTSTPGSN